MYVWYSQILLCRMSATSSTSELLFHIDISMSVFLAQSKKVKNSTGEIRIPDSKIPLFGGIPPFFELGSPPTGTSRSWNWEVRELGFPFFREKNMILVHLKII